MSVKEQILEAIGHVHDEDVRNVLLYLLAYVDIVDNDVKAVRELTQKAAAMTTDMSEMILEHLDHGDHERKT